MAQTVHFGVRAGMPVNELIRTNAPYESSTERYVIGPAIEIGLTRGFSAGADFLFDAATIGASPSTNRVTLRRWELPLMLTYRITNQRIRPFVRAGLAFNRVFDTNAAMLAELRHRGTHGPVAAAGIEIQFRRIHIEPEFRFTRWIDRNFGVRDSAVRSNLSGIEFLAGLTF